MINLSSMTAHEAHGAIRGIVDSMKLGRITYKEAKEKAQPFIDVMNGKSQEIARKYNKRYPLITFIKFTR